MTTTHAMTDAEAAAYRLGRQDEADECAQKHLVKVADILDAIDEHVGDGEQLRASILTALRCDAR
jgi:hypothetical protein